MRRPHDLSPLADPPPLAADPPAPLSAPRTGRAASAAAAQGGSGKGKTANRFATINSFADFTLAELTRAEIAAWLLLWRDTKDGLARTSLDSLSRRGGMNRQTAFRAVRRLERRGLLVTVHRGGLNVGPTCYRVRPLPRAP